jgi:hypothetical protein
MNPFRDGAALARLERDMMAASWKAGGRFDCADAVVDGGIVDDDFSPCRVEGCSAPSVQAFRWWVETMAGAEIAIIFRTCARHLGMIVTTMGTE